MAGSEQDTLKVLLDKATSLVNYDDTDCITKFAQSVDKEVDGPQTSLRLLVDKIQSPQEYEALQALVVLEFCIKNCGKDFQNEVGKFKFLNELIKVVSPRFLGDNTTQKVRDKVVQLMYVWSIGLKEQSKIKEAYQMLKQQGIVKQDPEYDEMMLIPIPPPKDEKDHPFKDDERKKRLEKLLKSKNPEDLQAANRLIKSVIMADQNRMEKIEKRCKMLEEVGNNVRLLTDMLEQFDPETTPESVVETMKELHSGCTKLRPGLFRLASDTDDDEQALMDILKANDDLSKVIQSYNKLVLPRSAIDRKGDGAEAQKPEEASKPKSSLIDLADPGRSAASKLPSDSSILLGANASASNQTASASSTELLHIDSSPAVVKQTADDVESLFASVTSQTTSAVTSPPTLMTSEQQSLFSDGSSSNIVIAPLPPPPSNKTVLSDIDLISRDLLEKTLGRKPEEKFAPKTTAKPTLNQMSSIAIANVQDPQTPDLLDQLFSSPTSASVAPTEPSDHDSFTDFMSCPPSQMLSADTSVTSPSASTDQNIVPMTTMSPRPLPLLSLTDVFVPLEMIKPSTFPPLTVYDQNGVRVLFHFAQHFATPERTDTLVTVISIMSTRSTAIPHIALQVAVPKTMKVKLQTPSSAQLAAFNPIVISPPVTQVMILANPNKREVKMKFKLDYKLDEQSSVSETGEIAGFPPTEEWGSL